MSPTDDNANPKSRRKHRRVAARELSAEVRSAEGLATFTVNNVSMGGALLTGGRAPQLGVPLVLELRFKGVPTVKVPGRALYEIPSGVGVSFDPISTEVAAALEKLVAAVDAKTALPPPLPVGRAPKEDELPAPTLKPGEDPFSELPDPRPPRSGSPDERAEYLRALVKNREESLKRGRAVLASFATEVEAVRSVAARLKAKLEVAAQQQALTEAALGAARQAAEKQVQAQLEEARLAQGKLESALAAAQKALEKQTQAQLDERRTAEARLEDEQRRTLEAIAAVSGLEAKHRRQEAEAARARDEAEKAVRDARAVANDAAGARKAREELAHANKKAMEAQAALMKERTARVTAQNALDEARAAQTSAEDEKRKLAEDFARMKARLVAAERALDSRPAVKKPAAPPGRGPVR